ncbi:zinc-binding metallopeptidase family protein [Sphingomonas profundi]|uniref:zinc-binding metallopeptidase family protein n=1 Tax=Alterirhizorhabdus profundi TaxID=2681549 RepID=UPI0018CFFC2F|nr:putative zinc-binding metallopeptidase [Sphingomonas profundi]
MAPFSCPNCNRLLHFEVRICPACHFTLGYDPASDAFLFLGDNLTTWRDGAGNPHEVRVCENNNGFEVCNWLVGAAEPTPFCRACRHNRMIPDLTIATVPERWGKVEAAKRRLFHTLLRLGVPIETHPEAQASGLPQGLTFDLLYDPVAEMNGQPQILTGHNGGLITLNLIEADDVERERIRREMGEPYRTLLGHFRHEVGHYYWDRLIRHDAEELQRFRAVFGDETLDYASALQNHYSSGKAWTDDYVSFYATSHPWEDFAETFAHLLHIVDTLAALGGFGTRLDPFPGPEAHPGAAVAFDPYRAATDDLVAQIVPYSFALNAINRSMGQPDLYPFHLSAAVTAKLDYVNAMIARTSVRPMAPTVAD